MTKWLVAFRDPKGSVKKAVVVKTLLKAQEAAATILFDLTTNVWSNVSRQHQNDALMYDGFRPLVINVEGKGTVTMERVKE